MKSKSNLELSEKKYKKIEKKSEIEKQNLINEDLV